MPINPNTVKVGDRVTVGGSPYKFRPQRLKIGETYTVAGVQPRHSASGGVVVTLEGVEGNSYGFEWFEPADEPASEPASRPAVDFSGSSRQTAREYAASANSRLLRPESQADLKAASLGLRVDAYRLNEALLDAMRSATTRVGQSSGRRDLARKIAYLGHITQAVLENHADNLPAYADGERSRKVKDLEAEKARLVAQVEELERRVETEEQNAEVARSAAADHEAERDVLDLVLQYAFERLTETQKQRVYGYWDGVIKD